MLYYEKEGHMEDWLDGPHEIKSYWLSLYSPDFQAKQKCIVTSLAQQGFQDCYKNVTDNKKKHCE